MKQMKGVGIATNVIIATIATRATRATIVTRVSRATRATRVTRATRAYRVTRATIAYRVTRAPPYTVATVAKIVKIKKTNKKQKNMKTKQVELELVKNLGNCETAKIRLVATITDKGDVEDSIDKLNTMILNTFAKLYDKKAAPTPAPAPTRTPTRTPASHEIKRDELGRIIVEFSRDANSLFQRIKRAVRVRQVDPDEISKFYKMDNETFKLLLGVVWNDCPIEGCTNKVCLALNSDKCFPHTKGHRQWKLLKIWWKNLFR